MQGPDVTRACGLDRAVDVLRSLVNEINLVPENGERSIVPRGDLGAILRFAVGKQNPDFLSEAEALDNLLSQKSLVAGGRSRRSRRADGPKSKNLRGRTGGGIASIVGCGGRI